MEKPEIPSWEEIYEYWRLYEPWEPNIMSSVIEPIEIHVDQYDKGTYFYGYDWLSQYDFEKRKETIEKNLTQFLYFTKPTNKGTMHTLRMLVDAIDDEERAAIWIYAFSKELSNMHFGGNNNRYSLQLCYATQKFLGERFYLWHHLMKKLVPELYINQTLFSETEFNSIYPVIELARLNAALVLHEYIPVLYSSLKPGERLQDYSIRLKNEN